MNTNRMNNRCVTPPGVPFQNRPAGRPGVAPVQGCVPCPETIVVCETVPVSSCTDTGASGVIGGIIGQSRNEDCNKEYALQGLPIAMAYVPWQNYGNIYPVAQALRQGTMFAELDLDFLGRRCN